MVNKQDGWLTADQFIALVNILGPDRVREIGDWYNAAKDAAIDRAIVNAVVNAAYGECVTLPRRSRESECCGSLVV